MEIEIIIIVSIVSIIFSIISVVVANKLNKAKFDIYTEKAIATSKVIEHEAQVLLKDAKNKARRDYDREFNKLRKELESKQRELENFIDDELLKNKKEKKIIENTKSEVQSLQKGLEVKIKTYSDKIKKVEKILENASGLTKKEATSFMLEQAKDDNRAEIASLFRKEYKLAKEDSKKEINNILSTAVTRYAGEFAAERLINHIPLPDDEAKGKIIGKEGRNIKALEFCFRC